MITEKEIQEAIALEQQRIKEAENDNLDFLLNVENKETDSKQDANAYTKEKHTTAKNNRENKTVSKAKDTIELKFVDTEKGEDDVNIPIQIDNKQEEDIDSEKGEDDEEDIFTDENILGVTEFLNSVFNLGIPINESVIAEYTPEQLLESAVAILQENAIKEYQKEIEDSLYKTKEAFYLDNFLSAGGSIEDFITYYVNEKENISTFDKTLEEIQSYSPEQFLFSLLIEEGFNETEAYDYLRKLQEKDALLDEYNKEIEKIKRSLEKSKSEYIQEKLTKLAEQQQQERIKEYEELEKVKTNIANVLSKIDSIGGFNLDDHKKEQVFEFLTQQDEDGLTLYDKFLSQESNLVLQAIFALYGKDILSSIRTISNERGKKTMFSKLPASPLLNQKKQVLTQINLDSINEF